MIVNPEVVEELRHLAGSSREQRAKDYVIQKRVNIKKVIYEDHNNFEIRSKVRGNRDSYDIYIQVKKGEIEDVSCNCEDYYSHYGTCKHILATMLEFEQNENYIRIFAGKTEKRQNDRMMYQEYQKQEERYLSFKQLIHTFYPNYEEEKEIKRKKVPHSIKLQPKLIYNSYLKTLKLEIKIGEKQFYKLKNLPEFYDRMQKKEYYCYGAKLEFVHEEEAFSAESIKLLQYVLKYAEIIKYANEATNSYSYYGRNLEDSYITISNSGMDEFFEIMQGQEVIVQREGKEEKILFLKETPEIKITIEEEGKREYKLTPNIDIYGYDIIEGRQYQYVWINHALYQCDETFKETTLKLLQVFRDNFTNQITFPKEEMPKLFSLVFPKVRDQIEIGKLKAEEIEKYIPKELAVKVYLDYNDNNYITADLKFVYEEQEFNPLLEQQITIPRDMLKEDEVLEIFKKSGFMLEVEKARLILVKEEDIYHFLTQDIENYMKKFEVLATDNFKKKEVKAPKIGNLGVRIENNLLTIDFSNIDFDLTELNDIMQKYHLKKKYHRLKDGSFIHLEESETIDFMDHLTSAMEINSKELEKGKIQLPVYRSLYLNRILQTMEQTAISKNNSYQELIHQVENKECLSNIPLPKNLNATLRNYQKIGYQWLKVLDTYKFGGILADDMGLRKNHPIISCYIGLYPKRKEPKTKYCSVSKFFNFKLAKRNKKVYSYFNLFGNPWKCRRKKKTNRKYS